MAQVAKKQKKKVEPLKTTRWVIRGSYKHGYPKGPIHLWQSWRTKFAVPILFKSLEEAEAYADNHMGKNPENRKKITYTISPKTFPCSA